MKNPLIQLIRLIALRRGASHVATKLLPLSQIHEAVVFVDSDAPDFGKTEREVRDFFAERKIDCTIFSASKPSLNIAGYLRKKVRLRKPTRSEQLFISLVADPECFAAEYEAKCSRAIFKIGRCLYRPDVFDLRYSSPERETEIQPQGAEPASGEALQTAQSAIPAQAVLPPTPQSEVFADIVQLLQKIV